MSNTARFAVVLTCVCLAAAVGIAGVYQLTKAPIAEKLQATEDQLRMAVLPGAAFFKPVDGPEGPCEDVCAGYDRQGGSLLGYVAKGEGKGYGGKLVVMVGMKPDLAVAKAAVLLQNETPGLGAELGKVKTKDTIWTKLAGRASGGGTSWMDRFSGKTLDQLDLGKGIDAKSGCTITSKAIVQAARDAAKKIMDAAKAGEKT